MQVVKTGGTSVRSALKPFADKPRLYPSRGMLRALRIPMPYPRLLAPRMARHPTAMQICSRLPDSVFSAHFKFAFVRNPWDHLVSKYFFIVQKPNHPMHDKVSSLGGFGEYVALQTRRPSAPQGRALADEDGRLLVDFVGRFENLAADFDQVSRRLQIEADLPYKNASLRADYRGYYTDRTAELVRTAFREDIEFFGFSFDGGARRHVA